MAVSSIPAATAQATQAGHLTHPKYRRDIDGLRAVAVLSVVFFHAFPERFPGGFIGVDIFFVISGFLISTILFENLERNTFSFVEFYSRRIRRIFPALFTVLMAGLVLGWIILGHDEYRELGEHSVGGTAFVSNFVLWKESGYFNTAAESKPLLHLWSLAVEEQFYIFFPLLLWAAWKRGFNLFTIAVVIALISFGFNIAEVAIDPVAAFYFPHIRFWELMAGAILAHITLQSSGTLPGLELMLGGWFRNAVRTETAENHERMLRNGASILGIGLVAIGLMTINKDTAFPGWWGLLPVMGATLLIAAGANAWMNRVVLGNPILVWFGLISYPLYLWHWVLITYARVLVSDVPLWEVMLVIVGVSVLLAWLTYKLIETPLRFGKAARIKTVALALSMLIVCGLGYEIYRQDGFPDRFVAKSVVSRKSGLDGGFEGVDRKCALQQIPVICIQDAREQPAYALVGDSKAGSLAPGLFRTSLPGGRWIYVGSGTPPAPIAPTSSPGGQLSPKRLAFDMSIEKVAQTESVRYVVVATAARVLFDLRREDTIEDMPQSRNYDMALQRMLNATEALIDANKRVVLLVDNPALPRPEDCLKRKTAFDFLNEIVAKPNPNCRLDLNRYLRHREKYMAVLAEIKKRHPDHVEIFDATDILCDRADGVCTSARNARALYAFTDHISDYASGLVGRRLNTFLSVR